jgi:prepilin-type N-terminal cleavage/methylation domain-containing protein
MNFAAKPTIRTRGFSLVEMVIVAAIALTMTALAIPSVVTVLYNYRLRSNMSNVSGLFQNARMMAVQKNQMMSAGFTLLADGLLDNTILSFGSDPTYGGLGGTVPTFNSRGLPCLYNSPTNCPTGGGYVFYFSDTRPLGQSGWAAISISPAGRIKTWYWNGSTWAN